MAIDVSDSFVRQYESEVHLTFQRKGSKLRGTVRNQSNVEGSSTTFQVVGKGTAVSKGRHSEIPPMNLSHTPVECTLSDHYAGDFADKLDLNKLNIDERQAIARSGANALGRKIDDLITTQMDAVSTLGTSAFTLDVARQMIEALSDNDVPMDEGSVYGAVGYRQWNIMLKDSAFSSSDFVGDHPLKNFVTPKLWSGVIWFPCSGDCLPLSGSNRSVFLYHMDAVGCASGEEIMADITWQGTRAAWWINHMMSMGAVVIDSNGIVKYAATES